MSTKDVLRVELERAIIRASRVYDPASHFLSEIGIPLPVLAWCSANPEAAKGLAEGTMVAVPKELTVAMHHAARDWSDKKYGKSIGLDASKGC